MVGEIHTWASTHTVGGGVNFSPLGVCVSVFGVIGHSLITGGGRVRDKLAKKAQILQ